jgi:hypothetical protein
MGKKIIGIAVILLSLTLISARGHVSKSRSRVPRFRIKSAPVRIDESLYNRSVLFIGLSPQKARGIDEIKKINNIMLKDIKRVLDRNAILTDLSEPYLYSRRVDLASIARSRSLRWIVHGRVSFVDDYLMSIQLQLYDSVEKQNVEERKFLCVCGNEKKIRSNMEYLYSRIAEANSFFAPARSEKADPSLSRGIAVMDFMIHEKAPQRFHRLRGSIMDAFSGHSSILPSLSIDSLPFLNMKTRRYSQKKRLTSAARALNARWIVYGRIYQKSERETVSVISLFDAKKGAVIASTGVRSHSYDITESTLRNRMENFLLTISSGEGYSLHRNGDFLPSSAPAPVKTMKDRKDSSGPLSAVFDGLSLLVSERGIITRLDDENAPLETMNVFAGAGKKPVSCTSLQTDTGGRIYAMDSARRRIYILDKSGALIKDFACGIPGGSGFTVSSEGFIFLPDRQKRQVLVYNSQGSLKKRVNFGKESIVSICARDGAPVVITDKKGFYRLVFLTPRGSFSRSRQTGISSKLVTISSCSMDRAENLFCADTPGNMVFCLDRNSKISWITGRDSGGDGKALFPSGISVNKEGSRIAVLDTKKKRVMRYQRVSPFTSQGNPGLSPR